MPNSFAAALHTGNLANVVSVAITVIVEELSIGVSFDVEAGFVVIRFTTVVVAIRRAVSVQPMGHPIFCWGLLVQTDVELITGTCRPAVND